MTHPHADCRAALPRRHALALFAAAAIALPTAALAQEKNMLLFKIVTVKDDIIIGLDKAEMEKLGGQDAGAVAKALAAKGELTVWQYGVRRGPNNEPQQAPIQKIGLLANTSLRVEPYATTYAVLPHE